MPKNRAADHASKMTLEHENKEDKTRQIFRNLAPTPEAHDSRVAQSRFHTIDGLISFCVAQTNGDPPT
jgi:hypothetical protein